MTIEQIAIVALLALQAVTLAILCGTYRQYNWFREAWTRDSWELLYWKRNALLRDPETGRYHKRGES